jgi:hypothetical protein
MLRWLRTAVTTGLVADAKVRATGSRNEWNATPANATFADTERTKNILAFTFASLDAQPCS